MAKTERRKWKRDSGAKDYGNDGRQVWDGRVGKEVNLDKHAMHEVSEPCSDVSD